MNLKADKIVDRLLEDDSDEARDLIHQFAPPDLNKTFEGAGFTVYAKIDDWSGEEIAVYRRHGMVLRHGTDDLRTLSIWVYPEFDNSNLILNFDYEVQDLDSALMDLWSSQVALTVHDVPGFIQMYCKMLDFTVTKQRHVSVDSIKKGTRAAELALQAT